MKKSLSQKEAVYKCVMRYAKRNKLTMEAKFKVYAQLERDFINKKVFLKPKRANFAKLKHRQLLRNYVTGLLSNWLRKDARLIKIAA